MTSELPTMNSLPEKVRRYNELQNAFSVFQATKPHTEQEFTEMCMAIKEMVGLEFEIRDYLKGEDCVHVEDANVRAVLRRMAESNIEQGSRFRYSENFSDSEESEIEHITFWSWFSIKEYVAGYLSTPPLITVGSAPAALLSLVTEARRCLGFGLGNAAVSLARTIIEFAVTDIGITLGRFLGSNPLDIFTDYPPNKQADCVLGERSQRRDQYRRLYYECSAVIHGQDIDGKPACTILNDALSFAADLYTVNHLQYQAAKARADRTGAPN